MTKEENIRAILECNFAGCKEENIDIAVKNIMALKTDKEDLMRIISEHPLDTLSSDTSFVAPLLVNVIEWGQGYDDEVVEMLDSFQKFRDAYYELINFGDDWWSVMNQGVEFDEIMKAQWETLEDVGIMECIETMAIAIAGSYVRFDDFADGVKKCYEQGNGYRHKEK